MKECPLEKEEFESRLSIIHKIIGDFDLEELSNLHFFVDTLNKEIEEILISRLSQMLQKWMEEFGEFEDSIDPQSGQSKNSIVKDSIELSLKSQNRQIFVEPSLAEAKAYWYK